MKYPFEENLHDFYKYLLLGPLTIIYKARKETQLEGFLAFSNLIIDKFAIHSSSFIHLSEGIIELKKNNEAVQMNGYDLFTVNTVFRTMMENYATFNHLFIEPKAIEEQKFRFLLWKIDGLYDKQRFDIGETDLKEVKSTLANDKKILIEVMNEFENSKFYSLLEKDQLIKIYNPDKKKFRWRFLLIEGKILPLSITELIKHTCKTRAFINHYRYSSIHTHTNYLSLEHFELTRGKPISQQYTNAITRLAIFLTSMLIFDICSIDENAKNAFEYLPQNVKEYINGISIAIKNNKDSL